MAGAPDLIEDDTLGGPDPGGDPASFDVDTEDAATPTPDTSDSQPTVAPPTSPIAAQAQQTAAQALGGATTDSAPSPAPSGPTPPSPAPNGNIWDALRSALPMVAAGIAARMGGPMAAAGLLGGINQTLEQKRLDMEKQAALAEAYGHQHVTDAIALQNAINAQQERQVQFFENAVTHLQGITDPGQFASLANMYDDLSHRVFGTDPGAISSAVPFDNTKAMARTQTDAAAVLAQISKQFQDDPNFAADHPNFSVPASSLPGSLQALASTDPSGKSVVTLAKLNSVVSYNLTDDQGAPVASTSSSAVTPDNEQKTIDLAVAQARAGARSSGRPFTAQDAIDAATKARQQWSAAAGGTLESKPVLLDGKPALVNFNGKTGRYTDANGTDVSARVTPQPPASILAAAAMAGGPQSPIVDSRPDSTTGNQIDPATGLTKNAIYQNGLVYALTGRAPNLGFGNNPRVANTRAAIQNTAAALAGAAGTDLPTLQAEYAANKASLLKMIPKFQQTDAAMNTADDNLALAQQQSNAISSTGSPIANRYLRWADGETLTGNPAVTKFETYIYTAAREYAKVTSGSAASITGITDTAAKEAGKLLNAYQTPAAFQAATDAMRADMQNVQHENMAEINKTSSVIANFLGSSTGFGPVGPTTPASPHPVGTRGTIGQTPVWWDGKGWRADMANAPPAPVVTSGGGG